MKRKEVCEKAGLTPKALRLYEEKGLIQPQVDASGHNKSREYSQEDLRRLKTISMLRRALFTIAEIKEMLDTPGAIQEIFPQYLEWLRQQKEQLEQLFEVSSAVDITTVRSAQELTEKIKFAAAHMPLPASDIHFNFKKLDELEDQRRVPTPDEMLNAALPSKEHRQAYVALSRTKQDDFLARNDLLNDTRSMEWVEDGPVANNVEAPKTLGQKSLRIALTLVLIFIGVYLLREWPGMWRFGSWKWAILGGFVLLLGLRIGLLALDHRRNRSKWLSNIGWENQKSKSVNKKKIALMVTGGVLALALVVGGFVALAWYLTPVEPSGGPPVQDVDLHNFWKGMDPRWFGAIELGSPEAITAGPDRIYFVYWGRLYSINADYTELVQIDEAHVNDGLNSGADGPLEEPCALIYYDGCIYYQGGYDTGFGLMRHRTGTRIHPERMDVGHGMYGMGLSRAGEIICYSKDSIGKLREDARLRVS